MGHINEYHQEKKRRVYERITTEKKTNNNTKPSGIYKLFGSSSTANSQQQLYIKSILFFIYLIFSDFSFFFLHNFFFGSVSVISVHIICTFGSVERRTEKKKPITRIFSLPDLKNSVLFSFSISLAPFFTLFPFFSRNKREKNRTVFGLEVNWSLESVG